MATYNFDHWSLGGQQVSTLNPATLGPITSNSTIEAVYKLEGAPTPTSPILFYVVAIAVSVSIVGSLLYLAVKKK